MRNIVNKMKTLILMGREENIFFKAKNTNNAVTVQYNM